MDPIESIKLFHEYEKEKENRLKLENELKKLNPKILEDMKAMDMNNIIPKNHDLSDNANKNMFINSVDDLEGILNTREENKAKVIKVKNKKSIWDIF